jgi:hypothetical protein
MKKEDTIDMLRRFTSVVIWGLRTDLSNTHRHVYRHLHRVLKTLGIPNGVWCDDREENNNVVPKGSLVLSMNLACKHLRFRKGVSYAVLNVERSLFDDCPDYLMLRTHGEVPIDPESERWGAVTAFDRKGRTLHQASATDLLPEEFLLPTANQSNIVNWVGSIWNDQNNHGNVDNIHRLETLLAERGMQFIHRPGASDEDNVRLMRESRIAPAIGGAIQTSRPYLSCRVWKNISYGQLCVTNLPHAKNAFGASAVVNLDIEAMLDEALAVPKKDYLERTGQQQKTVAEGHTYLNWLYNVGRAFSEMGR